MFFHEQMPTRVVDIDLNSSTGATVKPTYNDIILIGDETAPVPDGEVGVNDAKRYASVAGVDRDFGDSDVLTASEALTEMGVEDWYVVRAERIQVTSEVVGDSNTNATSSGTVEYAPMNDSGVTISVDGDEQTSIPKTVSPPDASQAPNSGEAFYNSATGEITTGDSTSGTGSGIEVTYEYLDWDSLTTEIQPLGIDIFTMANTHFDRASIGNLDRIVSHAGSNGGIVVGASVNGNEYTETEAMNIAHEVGSYVPSRAYTQIAHNSSEDVASYIAGQLGVNEPWFDPFWDGDGYPFSTGLYNRSLVGDPSSAGTFEGGDENQQGATNVIISVDGTQVLSNSLTTAGLSSNYRYLDVGRTESFIASEVQEALKSLRLQADQIPFTEQGRSLILGTIRGRLQEYVSGRGAPLAEINVSGPTIDQISDSNKANRVFPQLTVDGVLAGNVHTFSVAINIRV